MQSVSLPPDFATWRDHARSLLDQGVRPEEVLWADTTTGQAELFATSETEAETTTETSQVRARNGGSDSIVVPRSFVSLAESVACHSHPERWSLLYQILWRITRGGERHLLGMATDRDIRRAAMMAKDIGRDMHKMRAFVRFRKVGVTPEGREQFVSWFEPMHHIVRRNAPFFKKRFTGMDWSILTPEACVHWDGKKLHFTPGVTRDAAPDGDELEALWLGYYKSIFNPARLKLKAMQAEMPVKYWKNLPEAPLIQQLSREASHRRDTMIETPGIEPRPAPKNHYLAALEARNRIDPDTRTPDQVTGEASGRKEESGEIESTQPAVGDLNEWREKAACCRACPLWENATQTVWGEGDETADLMIIGEQPGDQEDIAGRPFVGPAGQLLNETLASLGLKREAIYLTNAVKHFKWKPGGDAGGRGPRRLHDKANRDEMRACRPWLLGEIARVQPKVILTLGNSAAQALTDFHFQITKERGEITDRIGIDFSGRVFATVHPSYLLRLRDPNVQETERRCFRDDIEAAIRECV